MAACLWSRLIRESAYRTPVTPTTINTDYLVPELLDDDPVQLTEAPVNEQLNAWLDCRVPDRTIGETSDIAATLRTLLYPDQVPLLFGWALTPVDQSGTPDLPWTTTEPDGEFASMALDYAYRDDAGTERKDRYLGGKVSQFSLTADRGTRDGAWVAEIQSTFSSRTTTSGVSPAAADYPDGAPYFLSAASGGLSVNGQSITAFSSLSFVAEYDISARKDENPYVSRIRHNGLSYRIEIGGLLKFSPDWRALRDNRSTFAASITLLYPGGTGEQAVILTLPKARVADDGWSYSMPLRDDRTQSLVLMGEYDRATGTAFSLTIDEQA